MSLLENIAQWHVMSSFKLVEIILYILLVHILFEQFHHLYPIL